MEAQSRPSSSRDLMLLGFVILLIGVAALASEMFPNVDRYVPLLVGIGLLAVFAINRNYGALIFASILTGIGTGLVLAQVFNASGEFEGGLVVLGLGLGFISIWPISIMFRLRESHWWPLIPGTILTIVGLSLLFNAFKEPLFAPIVMVAIGLVLIAVAFVRMRGTQSAS